MENKHARSIVIIIVLAAIVVIAGFIIRAGLERNIQQVNTNTIPAAMALIGTTTKGGQITIDNLAENQTVQLPMTVTGVVAGWFFEGSFPVFLKDASGNQIGVGLASSSQNWMTASPIPFSVTLPAVNYIGPGTIVFTKDNPSGEVQYDDSYTVNVVFQ